MQNSYLQNQEIDYERERNSRINPISAEDEYRSNLDHRYNTGSISSENYHSELKERDMINHRAKCELSHYALEREIELSEREEC